MNYSIRKIINNGCMDTNKKVLQFFHFLFSEGSYTWIKLIVFFILFSSCSKDSDLPNENDGDNGTNTTGIIPPVVEPDVGIAEHSTKINQIKVLLLRKNISGIYLSKKEPTQLLLC